MDNRRFLQTDFWAQFKSSHGWKPFSICTEEFGSISVLVRTFSILHKKFSIAYVPMAPERILVNDTDEKYFNKLLSITNKLKEQIPDNTICVRYDPPLDFFTTEERDTFIKSIPILSKKCSSQTKLSVKHSPTAVQPPDTTLLDLQKSEDEILSGMKSKWRYNIKLAQKKNVIVKAYHFGDEGFDKAFDSFYNLFETTGKRDGISPHAKTYYLDLLKRGSEINNKDIPNVTLYIASNEDNDLAGIITLFCKREAVYLFGASGNIKRNLMPAYLLQWTAIQDAKSFGCPVYDFYGMPPTDDPSHPMHGLYLFKTGFGGTIVHRPGSIDVPLNRMYNFYISAEKLRAFYHKKFLKKIRGR